MTLWTQTPYVDDTFVEAFRRGCNLGVFVHLATDPPLRVWMGCDEIAAGMPAVDPSGTVYTGAGQLLDIPDLELLINGLADQVTLSLSLEAGLYAQYLAGLDVEAPEVRGARCRIGVAPLDERWQMIGSIKSLWTGTGDFWGVEHKPADDPTKPATRTISLTIGVGDTSRAQPRLTTFTSAAQRLVSPTDRFFERVGRYVQQYMVTWPRF